MWTRIKTRVMNFFGFWTLAQIGSQYQSPQANWREEIDAELEYKLLIEPRPGYTNVEKIRRLDRNDLIATGTDFYDYDYMETAFRRKR